ncbi:MULTISPECIES: HNH endonuclease [Ruegeria]|uniref:HNH endonuclease n=1 Tax=Ruegeria TaxID=97050 RepID=UPI00147C78BF
MRKKLNCIRSQKWKLQNGRCYYCGFLMWSGNQSLFAKTLGVSTACVSRLQCTAEHLNARSDGGLDSDANIVAACLHCNRTRHKAATILGPHPYRLKVQDRISAGKWHPRCLWGAAP